MIFASVFLPELLRTANVKILCDIALGRWFEIGSSCLKVKMLEVFVMELI